MLLSCGTREDSWKSLGDSRRSNQSLLKEINPKYSLEGLMLKLQYFGHLMQRADSFEKTQMLGKIEGRKRMTDDEMVGWHHRIDGHEFEQTPRDSGQGSLACCSVWGHKELDMTEWLKWSILNMRFTLLIYFTWIYWSLSHTYTSSLYRAAFLLFVIKTIASKGNAIKSVIW